MPIGTEGNRLNFNDLNFDYNYPNGLDLHPDSEQHRNILSEIMQDVKRSYDVISQRFPAWRELDEKLTVYIQLDKEDTKVQSEDRSKPVAMVIPINYATRESLLTYWTAAFMQHPLFRYKPSADPKDLLGVILLENIINQDIINTKSALDLYTHWSDAFTYGFGAITPSWKREHGFRTTYEEVPQTVLGYPIGKRVVKNRQEILSFEGNQLIVLDPYNCLPDPSYPIQNVQDMNFFGWSERYSYNALLTDERLSGGDVFNVKYLKKMKSKSSRYFSATDIDTGRYSKAGIVVDQIGNENDADLINIYKWIIPKDLELGDYEYPELWRFVVAADRILTEARPLGLDHNQIPVTIMAPGSDGHTTLPISILEREYPIQHAIDWEWKARVGNVRKSMNNMFVIDPSLVNSNDFTDTKFGMVARLRAAAWGRGVSDVIMPINVPDVTSAHVNDMMMLLNIDQLVFTSNQAKGVQDRSGERVSASEARDTRQSFLSKMEKDAKIGGLQSHFTIAKQLASNTIQLLEMEKYIQITGDYERVLREEYGITDNYFKVSPQGLDVRYDVIPQDGNIPGGDYADLWIQLGQLAAQNQQTFENIDFTRMWLHIARLLGVRNASDFLKKAEVGTMPNEDIEQGVQKGNIVPVQQFEGGV
jgi:hypothetical protein